jgi:hypothetical protein
MRMNAEQWRGAYVKLRALRPGLTEAVLLVILYVAYSGTRLLADNDTSEAMRRARGIVHFEQSLKLDMEPWLNRIFAAHGWIGLPADYWYSTLHYVMTPSILLWVFVRHRDGYRHARRALVGTTLLALLLFLLVPTAPPRFMGEFTDVLALHAHQGWWGSDASAPRGLGNLTNQLAAFPSLHCGWSLWCAIQIRRFAKHRWVHALGWAYALGTALVVIGTANHWTVDVLAGWLAVLGGYVAVSPFMPIVEGQRPLPDRSSDALAPDPAALDTPPSWRADTSSAGGV